MENKIVFTIFSDLHYKKGMYATEVADMRAVFDRAAASGSEFVLHGGDMCNDYIGSPELIKVYLDNKYGLPVYGIYGNHELESADNSMGYVTPLLTNDRSVVWGTEDGKIGDGSIAYYYVDIKGFRIVCTDTNFSFDPIKGEWQHNTTCSYGPPKGNMYGNSLGPVQFKWLEELLIASAKEGRKCIIVSHATFSDAFSGPTPDAAAVRQLFARVNAMKRGTVMLAINGHYHTNRSDQKENVVYFDMNTTRNCWWQGIKEPHYTEGQGFECELFDQEGNVTGRQWKDYSELWMSGNTWFSKDALSAVVTVTEDGEITIEGTESEWVYGLVPERAHDACEPRVSSASFKLDI